MPIADSQWLELDLHLAVLKSTPELRHTALGASVLRDTDLVLHGIPVLAPPLLFPEWLAESVAEQIRRQVL